VAIKKPENRKPVVVPRINHRRKKKKFRVLEEKRVQELTETQNIEPGSCKTGAVWETNIRKMGGWGKHQKIVAPEVKATLRISKARGRKPQGKDRPGSRIKPFVET